MNFPQLLQLPNGCHVRPDLVTSIRTALPTDELRARVLVDHGDYCEVLTVASIEAARSLAADLAARVNEAARSLPPASVPAPTRRPSIAEAIAERRRQQRESHGFDPQPKTDTP